MPRTSFGSVIRTKWVFKNKINDSREVVRNEARLVDKGFNQIKGIDFEETFALVTTFKAIIILLTFFLLQGIEIILNLYQKCLFKMDKLSKISMFIST